MERTSEDIEFEKNLKIDHEKGIMSLDIALSVKPLANGCSNDIPKYEYVGVSCDDVGPFVLSTGTERVFDETIYNTAAKGPELVGQLVMEKIEHYHRIWPDWQYHSVTYHKDNTGGMRCQFKFKRK